MGKPVLLKRGMATTIQEFLLSAEYVLSRRETPGDALRARHSHLRDRRRASPSTSTRCPVLKKLSHLPVVVDPSHGTGHWDLVAPMAKAAVACGADGLIIEVHPRPAEALSDGPQSLKPVEVRPAHARAPAGGGGGRAHASDARGWAGIIRSACAGLAAEGRVA